MQMLTQDLLLHNQKLIVDKASIDSTMNSKRLNSVQISENLIRLTKIGDGFLKTS